MPDGIITNLTMVEQRRLEELLAALRTNVKISVLKGSRWMSEAFREEFTSRLLSQHVFLGNPLMESSFETAFQNAAQLAGLDVRPALPGQRFWDLEINGSYFSLKTSRAKGMRLDSLHVSKLTEAAWIQDCRTAQARREHTLNLFKKYTEQVESIFQFRYFPSRNLYELVEIPCHLFKQVLKLPKNQFSSEGPSINIPVGADPPDFILKLDRSDAKITLANIQKIKCLVHATWIIQP